MKITWIGALMVLSYSISSCDEEHVHNDVQEESVTITLMDPVSGAEFQRDDTVYIKGSITSPDELHGYEVLLKDDSSGVAFVTNGHVHTKMVNVDTFWVNKLGRTATMSLEFAAIIDHGGTRKSEFRSFKVK